MSLELLKPISNGLIDELDENYLQGSLFKKLDIHTLSSGLPNIDNSSVCIVGVNEYRNSFFETDKQDLYSLRKELYKLKFSNWKLTITDLGNLPNGNTVDDTYHALYEICKELLSKKIIIIIIGGSNDIIYPIFKSFDNNSLHIS